VPAIDLDLCLSAGDITDVRVRPGGQWISGVLTTGGSETKRSVLRMWHVADGTEADVLSDPEPAAGRGLSGGIHQWSQDGSRVCVVLREGGLAICDVSQPEVTVEIIAATGAWSTPVFASDDTSVWAVRDWQDVVRLSPETVSAVPTTEWSQSIHSVVHSEDTTQGAAWDFAWDVDEWQGEPIFHSWKRPHMPWTQSSIASVFSEPGVAVQQPRVSRDGTSFGYLSDKGEVLNLTIVRDGMTTVIEDDCEHAGPTWGSGLRTWCFNTDGTMVAYTRNEDGFGSLWIRAVGASGASLMVGKAVHGCVSWEGNTLAAIRTGARTSPEVVAYNTMSLLLPQPTTPIKKVISFGGDPRWRNDDVRDELVEPTVLKVPSTGDDDPEITVRLYVPRSPNGALLSWAHGGPNDQWQVAFMPRHAYWLSRGFTIAVVDYRGSTGHGRRFQQSLEGEWGRGDASDMWRATRYVQQEFGYTPDNTVLIGGSAGGLAVLGAFVWNSQQQKSMSMPDSQFAAAAVLSYPVVDVLALSQTDDPFEAHYVPTLVGAHSESDPVWSERSPHLSPLSFVGVPLLIFHGDSDSLVPLQQSEALRDAVTSVGGDVTLHVMVGEGHGFRGRKNQEFEYSSTEAFISRFVP